MISVPDTGNSSVNRPAFPVPDDDGAAKHLIAGTRLPDVALVATRGASVNLARYQERAVVFVYPMTGTPGVANPPDWDRIPGAHGSTPEAEGSLTATRSGSWDGSTAMSSRFVRCPKADGQTSS